MNDDIPSLELHEKRLKGHYDCLVNYGERVRELENQVFNLRLTVQELIDKLTSVKLVGSSVESWETPK